MFVDLRPYMNATPFTVHVHAPLDRAYRLFRGHGLRHLVVVNDSGDAVGIITRSDLLPAVLEAAYMRKRSEAMTLMAAAGKEFGGKDGV